MRRAVPLTLLLTSVLGWPDLAGAQAPLTLPDAVDRARVSHAEVRAADRRVAVAEARMTEARAGLLPRVDVSESWLRGTGPVFAFSALLGQRRFSAADFDIARLNHPEALDNFRTGLVVEQNIFDATTRAGARGAAVGREMAVLTRDHTAERVALDTIDAYGRVLFAEALVRASAAASESAAADKARAEDRRSAGMATDADVLSFEVLRLSAGERALHSANEVRVARERLNYLMGQSPEAQFTLAPVPPPAVRAPNEASPSMGVLDVRSDVRLARAAVRSAEAGLAAARAAFLPQVVARGGAEWNGGTFGSRAHAWFLGAEVRINVFRGFADRARLSASRAELEARGFERDAALDRARLDIRSAESRRATAEARVAMARAAVAAAIESRRIIRDRYDNGLAEAASLVAGARAVIEAEAQAVAAEVDLVVESARLQAAMGAL